MPLSFVHAGKPSVRAAGCNLDGMIATVPGPTYLPELRAMLRDGVSLREASRRLGKSRGACFEAIKRHGRGPSGDAVRCPECGYLITSRPCRICDARGRADGEAS